jgi:hypothetical protein
MLLKKKIFSFLMRIIEKARRFTWKKKKKYRKGESDGSDKIYPLY